MHSERAAFQTQREPMSCFADRAPPKDEVLENNPAFTTAARTGRANQPERGILFFPGAHERARVRPVKEADAFAAAAGLAVRTFAFRDA